MKEKSNDYGLIFWVHLLVIIGMYISPFVLSWKIILAAVFVYYLQLLIVGGCFLTRMQFEGDKEKTFYTHYLAKWGLRFNKKMVTNFINYILPWLILFVALVWQVVLNKKTAG